VILEGRGRAGIGNEVIDVMPGDVVIIAPGQPQRISNTGAADLVFLAICTPRFQPANYSEIPELEKSS
ncbi:MAG: cupin domain-containing protein, partial [Wenzhouxiangellaceae bacterium]